MMWLRNPKNVKVITLFVAAIFILGIAFTGVSSFGGQAEAAPASSVAVVDMSRITAESKDFQSALQSIQREEEQARNDYQTKTATMATEQEKQEYAQQLSQRLEKTQTDISKEWERKLTEAVKKAADAKGYTVVLPKDDVLFGGHDLTEEVLKQLNK